MAKQTQRRKTPSKKKSAPPTANGKLRPIEGIPPRRVSIPGHITREEIVHAVKALRDYQFLLKQINDLREERRVIGEQVEVLRKSGGSNTKTPDIVDENAKAGASGLWGFINDYGDLLEESSSNIVSIGNRLQSLTGHGQILKDDDYHKSIDQYKNILGSEGRTVYDLLHCLTCIHRHQLKALLQLTDGFAQVV